MDELLSELIAIPSQSGNEVALALHIKNRLESYGLKPLQHAGNIFCHITGETQSKALIFDGHIDTVGTGDIDLWNTEPFTPIIRDGKMYGLGASDMKAGIALLMELARQYSIKPPSCDVWFAFVCNEETDGSGTMSFIKWFKENALKYDHVEALIAEPTNASFMEIGHRGNQFVTITVTAESGHASQVNDSKQNAIAVLGDIITELPRFEHELQATYTHAQLGKPTVAITGVWAGDIQAPNKIAGEATLQLDIRTTPEIHARTAAVVDAFLKSITSKAEVTRCEGSPAGWTNENSILRQLFKRDFPDITQKAMLGSSDLCFFSDENIPAILFGPGQKNAMHAPNEYAELASLQKGLVTIEQIVRQYASA